MFGVDAAKTAARWLEEGRQAGLYQNLSILDKTPFERLPFSAEQITILVSQYGIEYSNRDSDWAEVFRVLARKARIALILHKQSSQVTDVATDEALLAAEALRPSGLFELAETMIPFAAQAGTESGRGGLRANVEALRAKAAYNAGCVAFINLSERLAHGGFAHEILRTLSLILSAATHVGAFDSASRARRARLELELHQQRMSAQRAAALTRAGVSEIERRVREQGFSSVDVSTIYENGHEMGWTFTASRV